MSPVIIRRSIHETAKIPGTRRDFPRGTLDSTDLDARGAAVPTVVPAVVLVTGNVWLPARRTPAFARGAADGTAAAVRLIVPACPVAPDRTGAAFAAALLNAVSGYCPECEMHLLLRRTPVLAGNGDAKARGGSREWT
ncbi:hypothetical protein ACIF80_13025 [Streptomyces sp. NPDC085927]|uniref:hypothetical protein n=1 Tax=Streptomyces sp. NPDC085927 TaxID=3365738 RepID=UPI0037D71C68